MKTVIQKALKLSFEVPQRNGSHFEKTAQKDFMSFCIFSIATGVQIAKPPDFYHGNTLDMLAYAEAPPIFLIGLSVVNNNHLQLLILSLAWCRIKAVKDTQTV